MWRTFQLLSLLLFTSLGAPIYPQQTGKTPSKAELKPRRTECGLFLPAADERHDIARLVRSQEFVDCECHGYPKTLAPPWKTTEEGTKKLGDACEYFAGESARDYPQVAQDDIILAADRCRVQVLLIIIPTLVPGQR
jgi:hypothetical protein